MFQIVFYIIGVVVMLFLVAEVARQLTRSSPAHHSRKQKKKA